MDNRNIRSLLAAGGLLLASATIAPSALAAGDAETIPSQKWSFDGVFGTYDREQLKRGLKVYSTVCATCHGLRHVYYRNLTEIGLTPSEAKAVAAKKKVKDIGDDGETKERTADLKDRFVSPFANDQAAKTANNGALPPDLSLIVKAREGGADYIHALLTGYSDPPKDWKDSDGKPRKLEPGQQYNKYFAGNIIAMLPPLSDEAVEYDDKKIKSTVDQMARDVTAFLAWAAEPTLEVRKRTGIKVMLFLFVFCGVWYAIKKRVWRKAH